MSRTRLEKNPDLVCGVTWGGTPDLGIEESGWSCPHVCYVKLSEHGDEHVCCGAREGRISAE